MIELHYPENIQFVPNEGAWCDLRAHKVCVNKLSEPQPKDSPVLAFEPIYRDALCLNDKIVSQKTYDPDSMPTELSSVCWFLHQHEDLRKLVINGVVVWDYSKEKAIQQKPKRHPLKGQI